MLLAQLLAEGQSGDYPSASGMPEAVTEECSAVIEPLPGKKTACASIGIPGPRRRRLGRVTERRSRPAPVNKLSEENEIGAVCDLLRSPRFVDRRPTR